MEADNNDLLLGDVGLFAESDSLFEVIKELMQNDELTMPEKFQALKSSNKLVKRNISLKENFEQVLRSVVNLQDRGQEFEGQLQKLCKHYGKDYQGFRSRSNAITSKPTRGA